MLSSFQQDFYSALPYLLLKYLRISSSYYQRIKNFLKIFYLQIPYQTNNENAIRLFNLLELSDFYIDHVLNWLYDYRK
jgi:hypothetical protein